MKNYKIGLALILIVGIVGIVGHSDQQHQLEEATVNTCTQSAHQLNRWADQCQALTNQVQTQYPNDEVLSNADGDYWIETKSQASQTCAGQDEDTTPTHLQCMANQFEANNDK